MYSMVGLALRTGAALFTLLRPMLSLKRRFFGPRMSETENGRSWKSIPPSPETLSIISSRLANPMKDDIFEDWWEDVVRYADKVGLDVCYVDDEFILEGELHKVNINFKKQTK